MNLLGGSIAATNHNTGVIVATICSNRHIWRGSCNLTELRRDRSCAPEHPHAFAHRAETNAVDLSTERSPCGPPVLHFRRKIVIARVRRLALAIGDERLIKRGPRASKNRRRHRARFTVRAMGTVHVDHQKDVTGFGQRLGRQAGRKIDPAQTREGRNARSFVLSHPRMTS